MRKYAVFGNPIAHSKSPQIHQHFAKQLGIDMQYEAICAPLDGFAQTVRQFFGGGGLGANITVPFKVEAFKLADNLSKDAKAAGAVNFLYIDEDGKLYGGNVDGDGLVADLEKNKNIEITNKNILILGAGGAARGVIAGFGAAFDGHHNLIVVHNRTHDKAKRLVKYFKDDLGYDGIEFYGDQLEFEGDIKGILESYGAKAFDIIINATSSSLNQQHLDISEFPFHNQTLIYDLAYSSEPTLFLQDAQKLGLTNLFDGWGMLVEQAAHSFNLWMYDLRLPLVETKFLIENRHLFI